MLTQGRRWLICREEIVALKGVGTNNDVSESVNYVRGKSADYVLNDFGGKSEARSSWEYKIKNLGIR